VLIAVATLFLPALLSMSHQPNEAVREPLVRPRYSAARPAHFCTALEPLLRAGSTDIPLTYRVEGGKYTVAPRNTQATSERPVSLRMKETDLASALQELCDQANVELVYAKGVKAIARSLTLSVDASETPLRAVVGDAIGTACAPVELLHASFSRSKCTIEWSSGREIGLLLSPRSYDVRGKPVREILREVAGACSPSYLVALHPGLRLNPGLRLDHVTPPVALIRLLRALAPADDYAARIEAGVTLVGPKSNFWGKSSDPDELIVDMRAKNADVRYALKGVMMAMGKNWTLDQAIGGPVTLSAEGVKARQALDLLLRKAPIPIRCRVQDDVYNFTVDLKPPR
jgi:hypothetical protein